MNSTFSVLSKLGYCVSNVSAKFIILGYIMHLYFNGHITKFYTLFHALMSHVDFPLDDFINIASGTVGCTALNHSWL